MGLGQKVISKRHIANIGLHTEWLGYSAILLMEGAVVYKRFPKIKERNTSFAKNKL